MHDSPGLQHRIDSDGILRVVFDAPAQRVNLLDRAVLQQLGALLDEARRREDVRAVLFHSAKPGVFIAGMDVEQIAEMNDAHQGAEGARFGQSVFQKIADLQQPSACAIGGQCLGGGTEMALACDFRLAADHDKVRIGLPEVQLGIIPGFGGTQRLPRLVGLPAALDLILSGRALDARGARKIGLVDAVVPQAYLEREAVRLLKRAMAEGAGPVQAGLKRRQPLLARLAGVIGPLRNYVLGQARKRVARRADPANYPAPFKALEAVAASMSRPVAEGFDLEARIEGELIVTPTSKNLIWLFKNQTAVKGDTAGLSAVPRRVDRAAVIGAGIMGGGIAQLIADRGIPVRLKDLRYEAVLTALRTAHGVWAGKLKRRRIDKRELSARMAFIAPTLDDTGLVQVDLVVEAVVENLEVKRAVIGELERRVDERAVIATNTSSLPIADIASRALRPERVVGLHFFNPVHRMPLVEVIAGRLSSPEAVVTAHALATRLGKTPVIVKDGPGFLVNRILTFYLVEGMRLLGEGLSIGAIDKTMVAFGMPMGPLALLDQVGLDTAQHVGQVLQAAFGERIGWEHSPLETMVAAGRLGQKNGRGFYRYRNGKRTVPDEETYNLLGSPAKRDVPPETLQERMTLSMINEAALCLEEGVVREPRDVDVAMIMGTGFPPFRGGVLRHADAVGIPIIVDRLSRLADAHGPRFRPARSLHTMVREQRRFYPSPATRY